MRILLLSSAFSGLTQRFYTELNDAEYIVSVELHHGNIPQLLEGVDLFKPDLIICPFLTQKPPVEIYGNYKCLIVLYSHFEYGRPLGKLNQLHSLS